MDSALLSTNEVSMLQTATTTVVSTDGKTSIITRSIFDNGSQRSYITEHLAKQLKLKPIATNNLSVFTFGSAPPKEFNSKVVKVQIILKDGTHFPILANIIATITGNLHRAPIDTTKFKSLLNDLPLADTIPMTPETTAVHFLIGSDYMWDILTGEKISLSDSLYMINSNADGFWEAD